VTSRRPWHDAPECPKCKAGVATPVVYNDPGQKFANADHLRCPACGHFWREADAAKIAQAWWSLGAWEAQP